MSEIDREQWRVSLSLPEYMVSSWGRIMRIPYLGKVRGGGDGIKHYGGTPYYGVWAKDANRFFFNFRGKNYKVHRLVCEAFNGPAPDASSVCMHLDEDSRNNRPENLKWGTQKENLAAQGFREWARTRSRKELRKLSEADAVSIRDYVSRGASMAWVAKVFGVSACHVSQICNGKVWRSAA